MRFSCGGKRKDAITPDDEWRRSRRVQGPPHGTTLQAPVWNGDDHGKARRFDRAERDRFWT
jgi:hypothetical protein